MCRFYIKILHQHDQISSEIKPKMKIINCLVLVENITQLGK